MSKPNEYDNLGFGVDFKYTGRRWFTSLRDVDVALANDLSNAFENIFTTHNAYSTQFEAFLAREPHERIAIGQFEDVKDFVRALRQQKVTSKRLNASGDDKIEVLRDRLPMINISRTGDVDFGNTERQITRDYGDAINQHGDRVGKVDALHSTLVYNVTCCAFDKETKDRLSLSLASYFMGMRKGTAFTAVLDLCGGLYDVECAYLDTMSPSFDDVSAPVQEERLYASRLTLTIETDVLVLREIETEIQEYAMAIGTLDDGRGRR